MSLRNGFFTLLFNYLHCNYNYNNGNADKVGGKAVMDAHESPYDGDDPPERAHGLQKITRKPHGNQAHPDKG